LDTLHLQNNTLHKDREKTYTQLEIFLKKWPGLASENALQTLASGQERLFKTHFLTLLQHLEEGVHQDPFKQAYFREFREKVAAQKGNLVLYIAELLNAEENDKALSYRVSADSADMV